MKYSGKTSLNKLALTNFLQIQYYEFFISCINLVDLLKENLFVINSNTIPIWKSNLIEAHSLWNNKKLFIVLGSVLLLLLIFYFLFCLN